MLFNQILILLIELIKNCETAGKLEKLNYYGNTFA